VHLDGSFLAEEMAVFCARISNLGTKRRIGHQNSNPCRKTKRFFCKDCCSCVSAIFNTFSKTSAECQQDTSGIPAKL
jgi:hypothetical protein